MADQASGSWIQRMGIGKGPQKASTYVLALLSRSSRYTTSIVR